MHLQTALAQRHHAGGRRCIKHAVALTCTWLAVRPGWKRPATLTDSRAAWLLLWMLVRVRGHGLAAGTIQRGSLSCSGLNVWTEVWRQLIEILACFDPRTCSNDLRLALKDEVWLFFCDSGSMRSPRCVCASTLTIFKPVEQQKWGRVSVLGPGNTSSNTHTHTHTIAAM